MPLRPSGGGACFPRGCRYCRLGIKEPFISVCDSNRERKRERRRAPGVTEAARGRPGSITAPRGGAQGDVPSLLIIDRPPDEVRDFISLRVCCDLLKDGADRRRRSPLVAPQWRRVAFIVRGRRACMMINGDTGRTSPPGGTYEDNKAVFAPPPPPFPRTANAPVLKSADKIILRFRCV